MSTLRFVRRRSPVVYSLFSLIFLILLVTQILIAKTPLQGIVPEVREADGQLDQAKIKADIPKLPISFIANAGQVDANVEFMIKAGTQTIFFTSQEVVFAASAKTEDEDPQSSVVRLCFTGASGEVKIEATQPLPGIANFFLGNDPENWRTNVATYATITYHDLYPGIDLIYSGKQGRLKSEFVVSPGADPTVILMDYGGASDMHVREDGALVLETPIGELVEAAPLIYQVIDEEYVAVEGGYRLLEGGKVAFSLGQHITTEPLVIDPTLIYSTYLGGSSNDYGFGIAVDSSGNAYVTGHTYSSDFPAQNPLQPDRRGHYDAFVTKLSVSGSSLVYSTYLGGSDSDEGRGIAVDGSGNAYVTGYTYSDDFPTKNALQPHCGEDYDAFVTKLNSAGSALIYSTYLGGSGVDYGEDIAVDGSGNAYVTGYTNSTDFPTQNPLQPDLGEGNDAFVTKLNSAGSALIYSTYLSGSGNDQGYGIAVDGSGNAYITGGTESTNFPTHNPLQPDLGGVLDGFVTKLNSAGSALIYSTYLGGSSVDYGEDIAVDGSENAYITGSTYSTDFPTKNALQPHCSEDCDAFVTKLNSAGSSLIYSTYLGGSGFECSHGIAVDSSGNAYVIGETRPPTDFPTQNPLQPDYGGGDNDAFVAKIDVSGSALIYSTYLGGSSVDYGRGIAVDGSGNAYLAGWTFSTDFPTQNPLQPDYGADGDAFVVKIGGDTPNQLPIASAGPDQTVTDTDGNGSEGVTLNGSGSTDSDGTIASWVWTESGTQIATGETPAATLSVGTHTITLTVTDNDSATDTDEVTIVIASGHAVNSPNEPSGPPSGEVNELLEFSTSISRCSKGHPVEYQFNWDSAGKDDLSEWSSSTSTSHSYSNERTYAVKARARCATDTSVESGWSAAKTVIIGPPSDEDAPTADASDITGQPETMHPDAFHTVTAKYYDADGRDDLNNCYLRLSHPSKPLTMMWYQADGHAAPWAGEKGERYITTVYTIFNKIDDGYQVTWSFRLNDQWPEIDNAIDFGVFASDDSGLDSGNWHYDDTNASFILEETGTVTGRVTDTSSGQGIDGAILLLDPDPLIYCPGTSGGGYFSFSAPAGAYDITASAGSYESQTKGLTITAGEPVEVNFDLSPHIGILLTVPYYDQFDTEWCWAASLAMMLKYFNFDVEPWEVAANFDKPPNGWSAGINPWLPGSGSQLPDLMDYLRTHFSDSGHREWQMEYAIRNKIWKQHIIDSLSSGSPVWLMLPGISHVILIVGASGVGNSDYVFFHDSGANGELTGGAIHQRMTWQEFTSAVDYWLMNLDGGMIYSYEGAVISERYPLSISVPPYGINIRRLKTNLSFLWDGSEPFPGYRYEEQGLLGSFPEDPELGYAVTLDSALTLGATVANASDTPLEATVMVEIYKEVNNTFQHRASPGPGIAISLGSYQYETIHIMQETALTDLSISEPGTYQLNLSISSHNGLKTHDNCRIKLRVAAPTPSGSHERVDFLDGQVSVIFDAVTSTGSTNVAEIDTSSHETGNIQVLRDKVYLIDTTATFSDKATISIHYDDSGLTHSQEKNLKMYKIVDTPWWKWWGDRIDITQTVDTDTNIITGRTDSFSTFLLGYETGIIPPDKVIIPGPNPVPDTGTAFFYSLPVGTSMAKLMVLSATSGRLLFETSIDVSGTRFPTTGTWDPVDNDGVKLANGPYLYVLIANGQLIGQGKMVIQR